MNNVNLEIRDLGVIGNASIDIDKINVVGGVNSSGKTTASKLLYCCLKSQKSQSLESLIENEGLENLNLENVKFSSNATFTDIFYLESFSIFDLRDSQIFTLDHIKHIMECLDVQNQVQTPHTLSEILSTLEDDCLNISSPGFKQIGVIRILLENGSLKRDSFLIIDEPESNLHPDWEIRFAEILVLLAKELNITLYLNSYSPIFIEAISLYSQYHDLIEKTNFYLTQKRDNGKYDFRKINPKNMGDVYENLTRSYYELDNLKAEILFRE